MCIVNFFENRCQLTFVAIISKISLTVFRSKCSTQKVSPSILAFERNVEVPQFCNFEGYLNGMRILVPPPTSDCKSKCFLLRGISYNCLEYILIASVVYQRQFHLSLEFSANLFTEVGLSTRNVKIHFIVSASEFLLHPDGWESHFSAHQPFVNLEGMCRFE